MFNPMVAAKLFHVPHLDFSETFIVLHVSDSCTGFHGKSSPLLKFLFLQLCLKFLLCTDAHAHTYIVNY